LRIIIPFFHAITNEASEGMSIAEVDVQASLDLRIVLRVGNMNTPKRR
jgi:hypothetical protein